jgi:hypothetical protein
MNPRCKIGKVKYKKSNLVAFPSRPEGFFDFITKDLADVVRESKEEVLAVSWVVTTTDLRPTTFHKAKEGTSVSLVTGSINHLHNVVNAFYGA